jgi:hypothetical protein
LTFGLSEQGQFELAIQRTARRSVPATFVGLIQSAEIVAAINGMSNGQASGVIWVA